MKNLKLRKRLISLLLASTITLLNGCTIDSYIKKNHSNKSNSTTLQSEDKEPLLIIKDILSNPTEGNIVVSDGETTHVYETEVPSTMPSYVVKTAKDKVDEEKEVLNSDDNTEDNIQENVTEETTLNSQEETIKVIPDVTESTIENNSSIVQIELPKLDIPISSLNGIIIPKVNVNVRTSPKVADNAFCTLEKGQSVDCFGITDNNWYLIRLNGTFYYVSGDYVQFLNKVEPEEHNEHLVVTANLNFRNNPGLASDILDKIPYNTELSKYNKVNEDWYVIEYNGILGYINANYTKINKNNILKIVYATTELRVRKSNSTDTNILYTLDKYETVRVLKEMGDWYQVEYNNEVGYVKKEFTKDLDDVFVVVDISEQKLTLFNNNKIILETNVVTGTKGINDTPKGKYVLQNKDRKATLMGNAKVEYWMRITGGYGMHDANWRQKFGGNIYNYSGSHGCINMDIKDAEIVYDNVEAYKTLVLIQK